MKNDFQRKAISPELVLEIDLMIQKIKESFGMNLGIIQASKVIAWKSQNSKLTLTKERLVDILGGKI